MARYYDENDTAHFTDLLKYNWEIYSKEQYEKEGYGSSESYEEMVKDGYVIISCDNYEAAIPNISPVYPDATDGIELLFNVSDTGSIVPVAIWYPDENNLPDRLYLDDMEKITFGALLAGNDEIMKMRTGENKK